MQRGEGYEILEKLGERALRAARMANAMLISGQKSMDREQKRVRLDAERDFLSLVEGLMGASCATGERAAMVGLGGALRRVTDAAAETAMLLRGRAVRMWALFDRVRTSVSQTERLCILINREGRLCDRMNEVRTFGEQSIRLAVLEEQSFEKMPEEGEGKHAFFLSSALGEWRVALTEAYDAALALLLEYNS